MKKWTMPWLLVALFFFGGSSLFAQLKDSVNFDNGNFKIVYSEVLEGPRSVRYKVECPNGEASRKGMDFYEDSNIHTSDDEDYVANEWDKGHMAPAASFNCNTEILYSTFTYVNSSLQQQSLNRGVWKKLENRERTLAQEYSNVEVFIRVKYDENPPRVPTNAAIPKGYYKEIRYNNPSQGGSFVECYYFKNEKPESKELEDYKCNCQK